MAFIVKRKFQWLLKSFKYTIAKKHRGWASIREVGISRNVTVKRIHWPYQMRCMESMFTLAETQKKMTNVFKVDNWHKIWQSNELHVHWTFNILWRTLDNVYFKYLLYIYKCILFSLYINIGIHSYQINLCLLYATI